MAYSRIATKNVWSSRFEPFLDCPVRASRDLADIIGPGPTTRRKIVRALLARYRPERATPHKLPLNSDMRTLLGLADSAQSITASHLLTRIDRLVCNFYPSVPVIPDIDLRNTIRGLQGTGEQRAEKAIDLIIARFDKVFAEIRSAGKSDDAAVLRLYNLLRLAFECLAASRDPGGRRMEGLARRLFDLAECGGDDDRRLLAPQLASVVRVLSFARILRMDASCPDAPILWHSRQEIWRWVSVPILQSLQVKDSRTSSSEPKGSAIDSRDGEEVRR